MLCKSYSKTFVVIFNCTYNSVVLYGKQWTVACTEFFPVNNRKKKMLWKIIKFFISQNMIFPYTPLRIGLHQFSLGSTCGLQALNVADCHQRRHEAF